MEYHIDNVTLGMRDEYVQLPMSLIFFHVLRKCNTRADSLAKEAFLLGYGELNDWEGIETFVPP